MEDDGLPEDWHNSPQVAIAGGVAALVLLCVLIYAVVQVSDSSVEPPAAPMYPTSSSATSTSTSLEIDTSTTSYPRTSVETSETNPAPPAPSPPLDTSADEPTSTEDEPVTTTSGSAGSI